MKKNILLEQFQKQKIPYCWNSFKIKNKKYHIVGTAGFKIKNKKYHTVGTAGFKIKNKKYHTVGTVSKSKTKIPYCWNSFKIKNKKYHTVGTVSKSKSEKEAKRYP